MAVLQDASSFSTDPSAALYTSDGTTRLFENYEGTTQAIATSGAAFGSGYLGGSALRFSDTGSFAQYSEIWWADNGNNFQDSGTVECYVKIDTFLTTSDQLFPTILTQVQHPVFPAVIGSPEFGFASNSPYFAISDPPTYRELQGPSSFNRGQWYHLAASWGASGRKLFVNGVEVDSASSDTSIRADTFYIGSPPSSANQRALGIVGSIDRLRLSAVERIASELPSALDVRIDSPSEGGSFALPVPITFAAFATETRSRLVDIYADTDAEGFNGESVVLNLPDSGTFLVGSGLAAGTYFLYAVAHADGDSAWFYIPNAVTLTAAAGFAAVVDPAETTASIAPIPATTESFTVVLLNNSDTTSGSLVASSNAGTGANHVISTRLMNIFDTAKISIWMKDTSGAILIGLRSDTMSLNSGRLPLRIPATPAGLNAFGATVISLEFLDKNGVMIGDSFSTSSIGETYAYTIEYQLSETTTLAYRNLGFDTSVGSSSFGFYYADTYGARWIEDFSVTVTVVAGTGGGINVRVSGISKDLPGGLGATALPGRTSQLGEPDWCLLTRSGAPSWILSILRAFRDIMLNTIFGRWITGVYYAL